MMGRTIEDIEEDISYWNFTIENAMSMLLSLEEELIEAEYD